MCTPEILLDLPMLLSFPLQLIDLGQASKAGANGLVRPRNVGTPTYRAPEAVMNLEHDGYKVSDEH